MLCTLGGSEGQGRARLSTAPIIVRDSSLRSQVPSHFCSGSVQCGLWTQNLSPITVPRFTVRVERSSVLQSTACSSEKKGELHPTGIWHMKKHVRNYMKCKASFSYIWLHITAVGANQNKPSRLGSVRTGTAQALMMGLVRIKRYSI